MPYKNQEDSRAYLKSWAAKNPDKVASKAARYRERNREKVITAARQRRLRDPEASRAATKAYAARNPEREVARRKKYRLENPERVAETHWSSKLKSTYGITRKEYDDLFASQNGACAICLKPEISTYRGKTRKLAVDHCHVSNRVRGLLCMQCNQGLGKYKDNPLLLRRAAEYLEKPCLG